MKLSSKFTRVFISFLAILTVSLASFNLTPATHAVSTDICSSKEASDAVKAANGCPGFAINPLDKTVTNILNGVIAVLGSVAVIFIVIGGVNYMTSSGDATKVKKARDTILYAAIGLVVSALAFAIVNFVIAKIDEGTAINYSDYNDDKDGCTAHGGKYDSKKKTCSEK